jgi:hypothetical protein
MAGQLTITGTVDPDARSAFREGMFANKVATGRASPRAVPRAARCEPLKSPLRCQASVYS